MKPVKFDDERNIMKLRIIFFRKQSREIAEYCYKNYLNAKKVSYPIYPKVSGIRWSICQIYHDC
jgi:hypothetical protein